MIDGLVLGVAMLASSTGGSPALADRYAAVPAVFTVESPGSTVPSPNLADFRVDERHRPIWRASAFSSSSQASAPKRFTKTDKVIAIVAGVAGGWVGGAAIGFYATQNRDNPNDDTSGLKGAIIGAPIGAAVGGILGYWLTKN